MRFHKSEDPLCPFPQEKPRHMKRWRTFLLATIRNANLASAPCFGLAASETAFRKSLGLNARKKSWPLQAKTLVGERRSAFHCPGHVCAISHDRQSMKCPKWNPMRQAIDSVTGLGLPFLHGRSRIRHGMGIWESEKTSLRLPTPSPINQFNLINTHLVGDRVLVR